MPLSALASDLLIRDHERRCIAVLLRLSGARYEESAPVEGLSAEVSQAELAAMAHLSLSTPAELRLHAIAFHRWVTIQTAANAPPIENCQIFLPPGPGLGINVLPECLGPPFLDLQ